MKEYFEEIDKKLKQAYKAATEARKKGHDPQPKVEIPVAKDMAERVEGIISTVAPQIVDKGVAKRLRELEKKYGVLDWRVSLLIAEEVAKEKFCKFKDKTEAMEVGIRVGFAYHTLGTVASPLEGFTKLQIEKRKDGKDYFKLYFSGPIRSAGGTGASVSVLIADYIRKKMGFEVYDPTEQEIKRYITELYDYHERITNLQYLPSEEEIKFLTQHIPVQIAGDPSEKIEVSNYKDLNRVETNRIRNGVCLVIGEGIAQKAPKLWKQLSKWGKEFDLEQWNFLNDFVKLQKRIKSKGETKEETKINPDFTFIKDLPAGRPILTYPMRKGGLRMRYGRSRTSGYSACNINPLTMGVMNDYIATGTQLKVERPGKGCTVSPCDTIEGPIVKVEDGSVLRIENKQQLKEVKDKIKKILFLGDILISYGDFFNRAHVLAPPGYCEEWWVQELEKATVNMFGSLNLDKLSELINIPKDALSVLLKNPLTTKISPGAAISISEKLQIPLHPFFTLHFDSISAEDLLYLLDLIESSDIVADGNNIEKIILKSDEKGKETLEKIGLPHLFINKEFIVIEKNHAKPFMISLGIISKEDIKEIKQKINQNKDKPILEIINIISKVKIRDKSGLFIGARMGRPEKAKIRELTGSPQVLFPVGEEGGRLRCFQSALDVGTIRADFPIFVCSKCNKETISKVCLDCGKPTKQMYHCKICGVTSKEECQHGKNMPFVTKDFDIKDYFNKSLKKLKMKNYPDLIKGVRGTSNKDHTPENLMKGILRAKHNIYVNKDGTTRYDMTQMPITHFKPKEIGTSIEKLKELSYTKDTKGSELTNDEQTIELKPQDIILPACPESPDKGADEILFNVANFIDDALERMYGLKSFYNFNKKKNLIGHLALALAPHTSAAILTRIIGFSKTQGFFAHPLIHAATRRDCDGDEASIILLMDALINFSRSYLPSHRGSSQDAPLVLTSKLIPTEVDDMVFDLDIAWTYPLDFYEACLEYKQPWDVEVKQLIKNIQNDISYGDVGFTHDTSNINDGVVCSAYKTIPSMEDKLKGQMDLGEKIIAVDESDEARLVIEKHFIKDTKGNLRKFSMQKFRCVKCNEKFRRPPLIGKCSKCGGKIIFTISKGSVIKYLEPSISLAEKYNVPVYLKQSLTLLQRRIEGMFGKEKEKQEGLGKWFG
ncbi:DNA polymerase II large subunit [Candidatus Woesearchaeota archaeon B3_Woes]|nr:MAG: DNA polymerase II large subunit [Candidatus Woesearchaeota archaeon B3_Woes]